MNVTYSDIEALAGFGNNFEISAYFSTSQENQLRSLLPNAMVTTYEYIPLVGVKTITQPNGEKIHYEYDDFNRLQFIKNSEGNILKENEYHYKD